MTRLWPLLSASGFAGSTKSYDRSTGFASHDCDAETAYDLTTFLKPNGEREELARPRTRVCRKILVDMIDDV
jgi:hypothetical protein